MRPSRATRWTAITIGLAFVLAACGGAASDAPTSGAPATDDASTAPVSSGEVPAASAPVASSAPADSDIGPLNVAVVTIGDERYEFDDVECSIFAPRYIQAGNFGADPEFQIVLPPEGWESEPDVYSAPSVQVQDGDEFAGGKLWLAAEKGAPSIAPIPDGSSQIDSYTVPDSRPVKATGTATFIDLAAHRRGEDAAVVTGTFEVSCP
jgi:hypothetical protein